MKNSIMIFIAIAAVVGVAWYIYMDRSRQARLDSSRTVVRGIPVYETTDSQGNVVQMAAAADVSVGFPTETVAGEAG